MIQSKLKGKAAATYNSLEDVIARDYDQAKLAILKAYEITSEAYRQKFRNLQRSEGETYTEFIAKKGVLFDRWLRAENVNDLAGLREMCILEDVKNRMSPNLRLSMTDHKIKTLVDAGKFADEYVLAHKDTYGGRKGDYNSSGRFPKNGKSNKSSSDHKNSDTRDKGQGEGQNSSKSAKKKCTYCGLTNHVVETCFKKKRDESKPSAVGLVQSRCPVTEKDKFIHKGYMSGSKDKGQEVTIYRDTSCWQSLML